MPEKDPVLRVSDAVSLRDHIRDLLEEIDKRYEQRFTAQEAATKAALASAQLAVDKAEVNAEKWRANANEWRAAMSDKDRNFALKVDLVPIHDTLDDLKTLRDIAVGKASQTAVLLSAAVGLAGFILGVLSFFLRG